MGTIAVTGGTGFLGPALVAALREAHGDVRVLSRQPGKGTHVADLQTGIGVDDALRGADVVVHAASDSRHRGRADLEQTRRLLASARHARHLIYVSIVGIDAIPYRYYRNKLACEREVAASGIPHTIQRLTQFHQLLGWVLGSLERLPVAPLPLRWQFQTVDVRDAAARLGELAAGAPRGRAPDLGGPEVLAAAEMVDVWRRARGRPRRVFDLRLPGRLYRGFREGRNTAPDNPRGTRTWAEFVSASAAAADG